MKMKKLVFILVKFLYISIVFSFLILFSNCNVSYNEGESGGPVTSEKVGEVKIYTAKGFSIYKFRDYSEVNVYNPWQGDEEFSFRYILSAKNAKLPESVIENSTLIRLPVHRIVCTSTTHIAFLESIGKTGTIVGISGSDLINNKEIRDKIIAGEIKDIGYGRELNYETLISLKPDLVMLYGVESEMTGFIQKLDELNIPVVMNGEYLEEEPLGKYEWIKFVASFFEMEERAGRLYDSVAYSYKSLHEKVINVSSKPVVMTGMPWKDVWYVSPGNTSLANYIQHAGATYLWNDLSSTKAVPMDLEAVYEKSGDAEYWINPGAITSLDDILNIDSRFKYFKPFQNSKIFNNNARLNSSGGNDYWESGVIHPDIVLKDLIRIFHPETLPEHKLVYYKKVL